MNLSHFSNEQVAGQRLMAGFDGIGLNANLEFLIKELKVGGVILFSRNISSPGQVKELCESITKYAGSCGQPPLFIAIDQEGGVVSRLKKPFTQFPGNPWITGERDAEYFARTTAAELAQIGVNMNMAPVLDVVPPEIEGIMKKRVFGEDPAWVSLLGKKVINTLQQNKIMAVGKHFPGIGRTILDSHLEMPKLDVEMAALESADLLPFEAALNCGVAGIMLSHILYEKIDPEWPASLSSIIARNLLRKKMGFEGIVMTDDMDMGAINRHYDMETAVRKILRAQIDLILICNQGPKIENTFREILTLQRRDSRIKEKGYESMGRILKMKNRYLGG